MPAIPTIDSKPLYALAGAGDAAVTALRARAEALPALVQVLPGQVKELRDQVRQQVIELAGKAEQAYETFAAQGEKAVAARRGETATKPAAKPATAKPAAKPAAKRTTKPAAAKAPATSTTTPTTTAGLPESPVATSPAAAAATQQTLNGSASV